MSFTQKQGKNILHCDGCEKHCCFDVYKEKTKLIPKIGSKIIHQFTDRNGMRCGTAEDEESLFSQGYLGPDARLSYMLDKARNIAKLCDHYKTR